ncbi:unnamed protein product, partial [Pylaiella littoralis]
MRDSNRGAGRGDLANISCAGTRPAAAAVNVCNERDVCTVGTRSSGNNKIWRTFVTDVSYAPWGRGPAATRRRAGRDLAAFSFRRTIWTLGTERLVDQKVEVKFYATTWMCVPLAS